MCNIIIKILIFINYFFRKWSPKCTRLREMSSKMGIPMDVLPHLLHTFTAKQEIAESRER